VVGYIDGLIRRLVLGSDPFNIEDLWLRMYRDEFWRGGVIATSGMSAIEIACWDIVGKAVRSLETKRLLTEEEFYRIAELVVGQADHQKR
jgi:Mandelate racemase / muconate lactonizing enzyme, N-terminal domain